MARDIPLHERTLLLAGKYNAEADRLDRLHGKRNGICEDAQHLRNIARRLKRIAADHHVP